MFFIFDSSETIEDLEDIEKMFSECLDEVEKKTNKTFDEIREKEKKTLGEIREMFSKTLREIRGKQKDILLKHFSCKTTEELKKNLNETEENANIELSVENEHIDVKEDTKRIILQQKK